MALIYRYQLFGLSVTSEIALTGVPHASGDFPPQVAIRRAGLGGEADFRIEGVASFRIVDGCEILVEAAPQADAQNIQLYLLGTVMGRLLHQRGLLPLHANAVEIDGRAVVVLGSPGAGKSTLAASLNAAGAYLITDDLCVVRCFPDEQPLVAPGMPRLRLWGDALQALRIRRLDLRRSYAGALDWDKWDVPVQPADMVRSERVLAALYVLKDGPTISIEPVRGAAAMAEISANTYRGDMIDGRTAIQAHWQACLHLAQAVPVFALHRPRDLTQLPALSSVLLDHVRSKAAVQTAVEAR